MKRKVLSIILLLSFAFSIYHISKTINLNLTYEIGEPIDSLNHVIVYYNGGVNHVHKRNIKNGYNIGLEYQCVEFVKRYYYDYLNHKMPDAYGHAKSFFNKNLTDGELNKQRNLMQFSNPSQTKPTVNDLLIMDKTLFNPYGHVAIISEVTKTEIEIIQQNAGAFSPTRVRFSLLKIESESEKWKIEENNVLGWLGKRD